MLGVLSAILLVVASIYASTVYKTGKHFFS